MCVCGGGGGWGGEHMLPLFFPLVPWPQLNYFTLAICWLGDFETAQGPFQLDLQHNWPVVVSILCGFYSPLGQSCQGFDLLHRDLSLRNKIPFWIRPKKVHQSSILILSAVRKPCKQDMKVGASPATSSWYSQTYCWWAKRSIQPTCLIATDRCHVHEFVPSPFKTHYGSDHTTSCGHEFQIGIMHWANT